MACQMGLATMAQASTMAEFFFICSCRKAKAAIMTITNGRLLFTFEVNEKLRQQQQDKRMEFFFVPITEFAVA